jgi:hypothetical protein
VALDIVGTGGRSGRLILEDEREDGTVVLLYCEELAPASGVILKADDPKPPPGKPGFPWPSRERLREVGLAFDEDVLTPFVLMINTTGFPDGPQRFRMDAFLATALHLAEDGVISVELDVEAAAHWGWMPEGSGETLGALLA